MKEKTFSGFLLRQVLLIGMLYMGDYLFFFFEQNYFNTYLDHVLYLDPIYISVMVSLSATVGLISMPLWGIASDNTRTKFGRRRPFLLFGIIAGIGMILFGFAYPLFGRTQTAFLWCLIIDVVIIGFFTMPFAGIFANKILFMFSLPFILVGILALLTPLNAWSQDLLPSEKRGKFTGIFNIVNTVSQIIGSFAGALIFMIFGISWIFVLGPVFFIASIPFFMKVKETVKLK